MRDGDEAGSYQLMRNLCESEVTRAVALEVLEEERAAPLIAALGEQRIARYIVECARRHGIPIVERPELCDSLCECEIDDQIPMELFEAAAVVLHEVQEMAVQSDSKKGASTERVGLES